MCIKRINKNPNPSDLSSGGGGLLFVVFRLLQGNSCCLVISVTLSGSQCAQPGSVCSADSQAVAFSSSYLISFRNPFSMETRIKHEHKQRSARPYSISSKGCMSERMEFMCTLALVSLSVESGWTRAAQEFSAP